MSDDKCSSRSACVATAGVDSIKIAKIDDCLNVGVGSEGEGEEQESA